MSHRTIELMKKLIMILILLLCTVSAYSETLRRLEAYAGRGDRDAQYKLGLWYYSGYNIDQDFEKAAEYFELSAGQGYIDAQFMLAYLYFYGIGVDKNHQTGLQWFKKCAEQDYGQAQFDLGYIYYFGIEVPADREKALYWMERALGNGIEEAREYKE